MPRFPFLALALAPSIPLSLGVASCSGAKATGLIVAVQTDLSVTKDFDKLGLYITVDGRPVFANEYPFDTDGKVRLPSTIAVRPSENPAAVVRVRAVAFRKGEARVLRQSITTIPTTRVAVLRMPLEWLAAGTSTKGSEGDYIANPFARERNLCPSDDQTSDKGICIASSIAIESLPDYVPAEIFGGGDESGVGGGCFDVGACFAASVKLAPDADCTVPYAGSATGLNVAVATTTGEGEPVAGETLVVQNQSAWTVSGGRVHLPAALCQAPKKTEVKSIVLATACATKTEKYPVCGPFSTGKPLPLLGDAGPLPGDGGGDAGLPLIEDFGSAEPNVGALAVGPKFIYAIGSDPNVSTNFRLFGYDKTGSASQGPVFILPLTAPTVTQLSAGLAINSGNLVVSEALPDTTGSTFDIFALNAGSPTALAPFATYIDAPAIALSTKSIFHADVTDDSVMRRTISDPSIITPLSGIAPHPVIALRFADPVLYVGTHDGFLFRIDDVENVQFPATTTLLTDLDTGGVPIGAIAVVPGGKQLVLSMPDTSKSGKIVTVPTTLDPDAGADAGVPITALATTEDLGSWTDAHATRFRGVGTDGKYAYFAHQNGVSYVPLTGGAVQSLKAGNGVYGIDVDATHVYWTAMDEQQLNTTLHKGIGRALLIP